MMTKLSGSGWESKHYYMERAEIITFNRILFGGIKFCLLFTTWYELFNIDWWIINRCWQTSSPTYFLIFFTDRRGCILMFTKLANIYWRDICPGFNKTGTLLSIIESLDCSQKRRIIPLLFNKSGVENSMYKKS